MTRNSAWYLVLALLPLAFGGGWYMGQLNPRATSRAANVISNPGRAAVADSGARRSTRVQSATAPTQTASTGTASVIEATAPVQVAPAEIERLSRRIAQPDVQKSRGSITVVGTVHSEAGLPLAGVVLRAAPTAWKPRASDATKIGRAAPPQESFQDWVAERAEDFSVELAQMIEATTDATGTFELVGMTKGLFSLTAFLDGWVFEVPGSLRAPHFGDLELMGVEVFDVEVRLENADGTLASESEVHAESLDSGRSDKSFIWTPEQTNVRLAPGNWKFTGRRRALDHPTAKRTIVAKSEEVTVMFDSSTSVDPVVLVLEDKTSLVGRMNISPKPSEETWYRIMLLPLEGGTLDAAKKTLAKSPKHETWTESSFSISDIEPGTYALGVLDQNSWSEEDPTYLVLEQIELQDGLNEHDLAVTIESDEQILIVEVTGPDSQPLAGCSFALHVKDAKGTDSDSLRRIKAHGGRYELSLRSAKSEIERAEKGGSLTLFAEHSLHGDVSIPIGVTARTAELAFEPSGTLEVTVAGWERLKDKLRVTLKHAGDGPRHYSPDLEKHEDGTWYFNAIQPGRYIAQLRVRTQRWNWSSVDEQEIDVSTGKSFLTFDLPQLHELTVVAADAKPKARVTLRRIDTKKNGHYNESIGDDLSATFENLEVGQYILTVKGLDGMMHVRIPSSNIAFKGQAPNAMRVRITNEDGPWGKIGLEDGDLIVGAGGALFRNEQESMTLYQPGASWTIWRGSKDMELEAPTEPFGDRASLGVRLTPTVRPEKR